MATTPSVPNAPDYSPVNKPKFLYERIKEASDTQAFKAAPPEQQRAVIDYITSNVDTYFSRHPQPSPKGFFESLETPFGIGKVNEKGEFEPGVGKLGESLADWKNMDWNKLSAGVEELAKDLGKGVVQTGIGLGKAAIKLSPPNMAAQGMANVARGKFPEPPELSKDLAAFGGEEFAEAGKQAGRREYAGAAGSALAGLANIGMWFMGGKKPTEHPTLEVMATKGGATLPTGERITATPGILAGGKYAKSENIARSSIGSGKLTERYQQFQKDVIGAINNQIKEQATGAVAASGSALPSQSHAVTTLMGTLPADPGKAAQLVGDAMRRHAGEAYYQPVEAAMEQAGAKAPALAEAANYATQELASYHLRSMLAKQDVGASIRTALENIASRGKMLVGNVTSAGVTESPFAITEASLEELKSIGRTGNLTNNQQRILHNIVEKLSKANADAVIQTGSQALYDQLLKGRALTAQGYAMEDFGKALKESMRGSGETTVKGAKPIQRAVLSNQFRDAITRLQDYKEPLAGEKGTTARLTQALGPKGSKTIDELAQMLVKSTAGDNPSFVANLGYLGLIHGLGAMAAAPIGAAVGHPIVGGLVGLPLGAAIFARAVTSRPGAILALSFLKAAPKTSAFATLGKKLVEEADKNASESPY